MLVIDKPVTIATTATTTAATNYHPLFPIDVTHIDIPSRSWTAREPPLKKVTFQPTSQPKPSRKPGSRLPTSHQVTPGKGMCLRCGLGLWWTGRFHSGSKCWSWIPCFWGNHWCLMSLVTSWNKCWLNDLMIMLMVETTIEMPANSLLFSNPFGSMYGIFTYMDGLNLWQM